MLAQVILARRFGVEPRTVLAPADLRAMLGAADAALLIGDAALRVDPATLPFANAGSGRGVGRDDRPAHGVRGVGRTQGSRLAHRASRRLFAASCRYGLAHMDDIAAPRSPGSRPLRARWRASTSHAHIVFELGERDYEGMRLFLQHALRV